MIIDAHTHQLKSSHPSFVMGKHAFGIHPWDVKSPFNRDELLARFNILRIEKMYAIGECGLDRVRDGLADINNQSLVLEWHLDLAQQLGLPLILHCVRAHSDLVGILKKRKTLPHFMLHDFSGNDQQVGEYLKFPVMFSLGKRILRDHDLIKRIPLERMLLETDDQQEVTIEELYKDVSLILKMNQLQLEEQLERNFLSFFSKPDHICSPDFINNFR